MDRENDFVHGVTLHLNSDRITSAERIRLTYAILTSPVVPLHPSLISLYPDNSAGITSNEFTHVETIFPPHHYTFNQGMKQRWMTSRRSIPKAEMTLLRNHFGNDAAAYFEFIRFVSRLSLSTPLFFSWIRLKGRRDVMIGYLCDEDSSSVGSVILSLWIQISSTLFDSARDLVDLFCRSVETVRATIRD